VRSSDDDGRTWPKHRLLHAGPAAYSCLTVLPDGTVGCLYERGEKQPYENITFARFPFTWLTAGDAKIDSAQQSLMSSARAAAAPRRSRGLTQIAPPGFLQATDTDRFQFGPDVGPESRWSAHWPARGRFCEHLGRPAPCVWRLAGQQGEQYGTHSKKHRCAA